MQEAELKEQSVFTGRKGTNPALVFISYSHKSSRFCEDLSLLLENKAGVHVWYDKALMPGDSFRKTIVETIRDADYFIVLLSKDSVASEWVLDEVEYAKKLHKRILPIYVEELQLPDELDMILHRYHSLFWHLRNSDQQFIDNLLQIFHPEETERTISEAETSHPYGDFSAEEIRKMKELLILEKQGRFAECYLPENACLLGRAYLYGGVCTKDRSTAHFYFRVAQHLGNPDGRFYLLQMQLEDRENDTWDEPDVEFCTPIMREIQTLADEGCIPAMLYMGNTFWYGKYGYSQDVMESARYYRLCAEKGNARAQYVMAANYYYGDGVEQDYELAIMYANLSMEQSYLKSWRRWGKFYRDGRAVPQNYEKARSWYEKGAQMGDYNCYNKIGDMLYYGWGYPVDYNEAVRYYLLGEQAPVPEQKYGRWKAKQALGRCYELGHGVAADLETAAEKYLEGYRCGSEECKEAYIRCSSRVKASREAAEKRRDGLLY